MDLQILWFILIAVLWSGYFLLGGFDFGVGMLLAFVPRNESERGAMFESIGPVWDGNEVWLVVAGAANVAAPATTSQTSFPSQTGPIDSNIAPRSDSFRGTNASSMPTPKSKPPSRK